MLSAERLARIKVLHAEFEDRGMLAEDWGIMAHEHRAHLIEEVERLRNALSKIQWTKDCGIDSIDPVTHLGVNHADAERDLMYETATEAIGPSREELWRRERQASANDREVKS